MRVSRSVVGEREQRALARVIERGFLGMGEEVACFERELEAFVGAPVVCAHTGTSALHLALSASGIGAGDEVLIPSVTYVATAQAVMASGATPVVCDVDVASGLMDLDDARERVSASTCAIMPVHYAGNLALRASALAFAREHGLRLIEDAAHSFGGSVGSERVLDDPHAIACFSFDGIKNITSGEGGALVTRDERVRARARVLRVLGVERDGAGFDVRETGWRYHMSDLCACIGRVQLARFDEFASARRALAHLYDACLPERVVRVLPDVLGAPEQFLVPHVFPVCLSADERPRVVEALAREGIESRVHYPALHRLSLFRDGLSRPGAESFERRVLTLPLHPMLSREDVDRVCACVARAIEARA